ncbi:MAG: hypothetical protein AAF889_08370 [Cyanobacteria bacterium P01_D01_bin.73]
MTQSPVSSPARDGLPPIAVLWPLMTALGASIFGVLVYVISNNNGDEFGRLVVAVLMGGLIVGWLEWQILRLYRIPIGFVWCGLNAGILVAIISALFHIDQVVAGDTYWLLPVWGMILDGSRWWLLRSHFPKTWFWLFFCALGWVVDIAIFFGVGIATIELFEPELVFIAFNGAFNGAWIGLCRGIALMIMLRDRRRLATGNTAPAAS